VELDTGTRLAAGDILSVSTNLDTLGSLWTKKGLTGLYTMNPMETERHEHQLVEAVISPHSRAVGRMVSEFPLPDSPYKMTLVAVSRNGQPMEGRIRI